MGAAAGIAHFYRSQLQLTIIPNFNRQATRKVVKRGRCHSLVEEVADGGVVPPHHDGVGFELLAGQHRLVLLEPQVHRLPQRLELLVEECQDPEKKRFGILPDPN